MDESAQQSKIDLTSEEKMNIPIKSIGFGVQEKGKDHDFKHSVSNPPKLGQITATNRVGDILGREEGKIVNTM